MNVRVIREHVRANGIPYVLDVENFFVSIYIEILKRETKRFTPLIL